MPLSQGSAWRLPTSSMGLMMQFLFLALSLILFLLSIENTHANEIGKNHHILKNLREIEIFYKLIFQDQNTNVFNKSEIHAYVRKELKDNNINMLDSKKIKLVLGLPTLHVYVTTKKYSADIYGYYLNISLHEVVKLERNHLLFTNASTWSDEELGVIHKKNLGDLQQRIYHHIDTFIDSYRSANPHLIHTNPPPMSAASPTYQNVILQAQERLQTLGYTPGPIDGRLGVRTKRSLKQYQHAMGLPVTGDADAITLKVLNFTFRVQEHLKAAGFDPGPIDGRLGLQTIKALSRYQNAHGLPITGELDEATRRSLNVETDLPVARALLKQQ